ncbi:hypothetical protein ACMUBU_003243, partial [Cronobacter turicensis]
YARSEHAPLMDEAAWVNAQLAQFADNAEVRVRSAYPRYVCRQQMLKVSRSVAEKSESDQSAHTVRIVCALRTCAVYGRSRAG